MTHYLKIKRTYFEPLIDHRKPFEIRRNDRNFKVDDTVVLNEVIGKDYIPKCEHYPLCDCEGWEKIKDIPEYGEDEAIDACGRHRNYCGEYYRYTYSGRRCKVKIKEIFDLAEAGLKNFVAFTFDILEVEEEKPFTIAEEVTE